MTCTRVGEATVCGEAYEEVTREDWEERWCFRHRGRAMFQYVVTRPVDRMSWYGPNPRIECSECGATDGDCGFNQTREWEG